MSSTGAELIVLLHGIRSANALLRRNRIAAIVEVVVAPFGSIVLEQVLFTPDRRGEEIQDSKQFLDAVGGRLLQHREPEISRAQSCSSLWRPPLTGTPPRALRYSADSVSTLVDGGFHFSCFVHDYAVRRAIRKALVTGLTLVGVRNAGPNGVLSYYLQLATESRLICVALNSVLPSGVPLGGTPPLTWLESHRHLPAPTQC